MRRKIYFFQVFNFIQTESSFSSRITLITKQNFSITWIIFGPRTTSKKSCSIFTVYLQFEKKIVNTSWTSRMFGSKSCNSSSNSCIIHTRADARGGYIRDKYFIDEPLLVLSRIIPWYLYQMVTQNMSHTPSTNRNT